MKQEESNDKSHGSGKTISCGYLASRLAVVAIAPDPEHASSAPLKCKLINSAISACVLIKNFISVGYCILNPLGRRKGINHGARV